MKVCHARAARTLARVAAGSGTASCSMNTVCTATVTPALEPTSGPTRGARTRVVAPVTPESFRGWSEAPRGLRHLGRDVQILLLIELRPRAAWRPGSPWASTASRQARLSMWRSSGSLSSAGPGVLAFLVRPSANSPPPPAADPVRPGLAAFDQPGPDGGGAWTCVRARASRGAARIPELSVQRLHGLHISSVE